MGIVAIGGMIFGIITIGCGILVIIFPRLLSWLVGAYLLIVGLAIILSNL